MMKKNNKSTTIELCIHPQLYTYIYKYESPKKQNAKNNEKIFNKKKNSFV